MKNLGKNEKQRSVYNKEDVCKLHDYLTTFINENYEKTLLKCSMVFDSEKNISNDLQPEDIISEVIFLILQGRREIDLTNYKTFCRGFNKILEWYLLDYFNPNKNKYLVLRESLNITDDGNDEEENYGVDFVSDIDIQKDYEVKENIQIVKKKLSDNRDIEVFDLILQGYNRKDISKKLKISGNEVDNSKKRIKRKISSNNAN
ncbi:MAG: LuxR C-terminal-related transcriptional regulator [Ignavibacterium sp.]|nr:LuxR C-terminal-related transcriptional regulator [Ignavibacterium sp.]MCX7612465.1 LuxR C-terminal-related transcriptional regulator [Ignavibacterium sp.]MDW8374845.1 LuxR C-terminal-related transcriptional regulator [Ignavibacteriales bacterium]